MLLWAVLAVASADVIDPTLSRPTVTDVQRWSASTYMDSFQLHDAHVLAAGAQRLVIPPIARDEAALRQHLADTRQMLEAGRDACLQLPAYRGNDALQKAAMSGYDDLISVTNGDALAMIALRVAEEITHEEVVAAEALQRRINDTADRALQRLEPAKAAFAVQFSLDAPEAVVLAEPRVFIVPDLPPEGSALDAATYVRFSHRHFAQRRAQAQSIAAAYVQARSALQSADPAAMKTARVTAIQTLRTLQIAIFDAEDWLGDDSLCQANAELLESMITLLEGPYHTYQSVLTSRRKLRDDDRERLAALEAEIAQSDERIRQARQQADDAFVTRWHIGLYAEWLADRQ